MQEETPKTTRILSYGLIVMALTHTLTHSFQNMHSVLYPILQDEFALTNQQVGLITSIPSLCQAILSIPTGILSDRLGAKKMILTSIVVAIAGALIAGIANDPWMLVIAVSLLYINTTIYHPASYSFTSFLFTPKERPKALGLHGAGGTLGVAIGPISISILVGLFAFGWRHVYLAWVIPLLIGIMAVNFIRFVPTAADEDRSVQVTGVNGATKLWTPSLILFLVFSGLRNIGISMTTTFLSIWLVGSRGMDVALAGLIFGASNLMGIIAAPIGGMFASRYGEKKWTAATLILAYISFALAFLVKGNIPFSIFYIGYGFFNLLSMAANSAIMAKLSPSRQRGLGFALYFLPGSLMGAIAPMFAAFIADTLGVYTVFVVSIAVFAVAYVTFNLGVKVN
jgi:ACS family hexuronate transporter-like MFS transporter